MERSLWLELAMRTKRRGCEPSFVPPKLRPRAPRENAAQCSGSLIPAVSAPFFNQASCGLLVYSSLNASKVLPARGQPLPLTSPEISMDSLAELGQIS